MLAYFTASIVGKKHHLSNYLNIINYLKSQHIQVMSDHIINTTESQIRFETKEERLKFQKQLEDWISSADCMIAEVTFPSISVGYEISLALQSGKPVLVLYCEGDPPSLLAHHQNENLICEKYNSTNLENLIDDFLTYVQSAADMRFTFFITAEIARFLETISKRQKLPKSVYLRRLIEREIRKK